MPTPPKIRPRTSKAVAAKSGKRASVKRKAAAPASATRTAAPKSDKAKPSQQASRGPAPTRGDNMLAVLQRKFGKDSAARGMIRSTAPCYYRTGIDVLDHYVLGCGGLPAGRLMELYSEEGAGKSSLLLSFFAAIQMIGGDAVFVETEQALNEERADTFGVDVDSLLVMNPEFMEDALSMQEAYLMSLPDRPAGGPPAKPIIIGWDSIAATQTKEEFDHGLDADEAYGARAKILSRGCRSLMPLLNRKGAVMVWVNQTRTKMGVAFGDPNITPGGKAVKFHASHRLALLGGSATKDKAGQHVSKDLTMLAVKNRFVPPWRKARVRLNYANGWDNEWSTLEHAKTMHVIGGRQKGAAALATAREHFNEHGWATPGNVPVGESGEGESDPFSGAE